MAFTISAFAFEDTLTLDRCRIINDATDNSLPSKLAVNFQLPESIVNKEVLLAEIIIRFPIENYGSDSLLELRFNPLLYQPPEGDIDYVDIEATTDSLGAGAWTCLFDSVAFFKVDITEFVRGIASGERENYGLIGTLDLLGDNNIIVPENLSETIRDQARVKIIYK
jgi:hypothetical protein